MNVEYECEHEDKDKHEHEKEQEHKQKHEQEHESEHEHKHESEFEHEHEREHKTDKRTWACIQTLIWTPPRTWTRTDNFDGHLPKDKSVPSKKIKTKNNSSTVKTDHGKSILKH
jgi:hypothetical protein